MINYFDSISASGSIAAAREVTVGRFNPTVNVNLNVNVNANLDLGLLVPSYVFATPVFGGQLGGGRDGDRGPQHDRIERYDNGRGRPIHSDEVGQH